MTVRLRQTLLYGGLFFAAGFLLLTVAYVLVTNILESLPFEVRTTDPFGISQQEQQALRQGFIGNAQHRLLTLPAFALGGVGLPALAPGRPAAARALGPPPPAPAPARPPPESTLHERIAKQGPEDEIKELADTFVVLLVCLFEAFDAQRRFVGNASHELRTPQANNRTLLEVALTDPEASDDLRTVGRTLLANNARHERLIEGLLLLARSERELTTRTPVDLSEVATIVLKTSVREDRPDVEITTELTSGPALGDPVLLEHLVSNLIDNAVRYNVDDGTVVVRTGVLDGWATCQVENTGPVVPAYEVQNLFEPFRRLNTDRVESSKGAGLGLSIVRSVAAAHGGTVVATPRGGGGLIVAVRLPKAWSPRPRDAPRVAGRLPEPQRADVVLPGEGDELPCVVLVVHAAVVVLAEHRGDPDHGPDLCVGPAAEDGLELVVGGLRGLRRGHAVVGAAAVVVHGHDVHRVGPGAGVLGRRDHVEPVGGQPFRQHREGEGDLQVGVGLLEPRERLRAAGDGRGVGRGGARDVEVGVLGPVRVDHHGVLGVELVDVRTRLGEFDPGGAAEGDAHVTAGGAELGALLLLPGGARVVGVEPAGLASGPGDEAEREPLDPGRLRHLAERGRRPGAHVDVGRDGGPVARGGGRGGREGADQDSGRQCDGGEPGDEGLGPGDGELAEQASHVALLAGREMGRPP